MEKVAQRYNEYNDNDSIVKSYKI